MNFKRSNAKLVRGTKINKNKESLHELWETTMQRIICILEVLEEEKRKREAETYLKTQ